VKRNCAILGGGLAGLSCAHELVGRGAGVTVLEREDRVGGLARSYSENGFTYDLGPHRFLIHEPEDITGFSALLGEDLLLKQRRSRIFLKGRFFDYPLKVGNAVFSMPPLTTARILADYTLARGKTLLGPSPDRSFEDWVASRFGRTLYDIFFKQYTEKAWGIPCSEISADWASQRISLLSLWDTFKKTVFKGGDQPRTYAASFYYPPRGGIGALSRAMSDAIEAAGNRVLCQKPVRGLTLDDSRITRVTADNLEFEPDEVIGTLPLTDTVGMLGEAAPVAVRSAADNLRFRAIVFVYLFANRPRISEDHWIYLPEESFISNRLTEAVNFSRHNCPEGKTVICAEITCDEGDPTWSTSDDVLAERVVDDLDRLGFMHMTRADVIAVRTRRAPHAYPIYDIGYAERVRTILSFFESIENFLPIGRSALFRYNNMDHSIEMGRRAGRAILEGTDRSAAARVATGKQYFG